MNEIYRQVKEKWSRTDAGISRASAPIPKTLMLELTNACNLKCVYCANPKMTRTKGFMDLALVEKVLDQARTIGMEEVALYTTGESFLYKDLFAVIDACSARDLSCYLTSNGLLLTEERARQLCESQLQSFKFSVDGYDAESYESLRIRGRFDRLIEKMKLLRDTRNELGAPLKIYAGIILLEENRVHLPKYEAAYGPYVDELFFSTLVNHGGITEDSCRELRGDEDAAHRKNRQPCRLLWDRMVVSYDGRLTACCVDFNMDLVYADLAETSLAEAWNSEPMQRLRAAHLAGDVSQLPLCRDCDAPFIQNLDMLESLNEDD